MLKHPSGILQITPESLEALLMHKHAAVPRLFCDLRYVVIDEVHSLLRGDRGGQTLCLIERLGRMAGVNPRRIGLSATIGDPERTGAFLASGTGRGCIIPRFEEPRRVWRLSMEHFYITGPQATERALQDHGPQQADVLKVERVAGGEDRGGANDDGSRMAPRALPNPDGVTVLDADDNALLAPTDTAPNDADPGIGTSSSERAAASAWSLSTRARRRKPSVPCCAAIARRGMNRTAFSSIMETSLPATARPRKTSCG